MSIRQTRGAILFLCAQYRAILLKGLALAAAATVICAPAQADDPDTILENLDPSKGSLKQQRPAVDHAVADKTVKLAAGTEFDTGDDITLTINISSADPNELYVQGTDGSVAGIVVGADKGTGALELNGSGRIGDIKGTGILSVNYTTKLDENVVNAGSIGSSQTRFGDLEIGAHGGTLNAGSIYADSISLGESATLSSSGSIDVSGRIDVAKDASLSSSGIELAGGRNSVLYAADGGSIGTASLSLSSGSSAYVKSGFDKRASVLAAGSLDFGSGSNASSLIVWSAGALYVGKSYDATGFSDVANGLVGNTAGLAKSLAVIDTAVDLGANGGILLDGNLATDLDPRLEADSGKVTLRNGASMFLSSSGATSAQSYIAANGGSASFAIDDTSTLYIRDSGAVGDITGSGSVFINSEVGNVSQNQDVVTGNINASEVVLTGKVKTGDITTPELNINPNTTLTSQNIKTTDIIVGNDQANVSINASSITTTGQFSVEGDNIAITAERLVAPDLTISGSAVFNSGSALVAGRIFTEGVKFNVSGNLELSGDLAVADGADVSAGKLVLNGHTLSVDPDWSVGPSVVYAGSLSGSDGVLDGSLVVGQNSAFYVGSTMTQAQFEQYAQSNLSSSGTGAIAYFDVPVTVGSGYGILVDSNATTASTATADKLSVGPNSVLVLNLSGAAGASAVTFESASAKVENNGTIEVTGKNLTAGSSVSLFSTSAPGGSVAVTASGTVKSASIYSLNYNSATGAYDVAISSDAASTLEQSGVSSESSQGIVDYLSGHTLDAGSLLGIALNADSYRSSGSTFGSEGTARLLGSFARMPVLGGSIQDARMVADVAHESVSDRLGFGTSTDTAKGMGVWVKPVYRHFKSEDLDAGMFSYGVNSSLGGATVGFDGIAGGVRLGVALNAGTINSHSTGDLAYTKGDFDYAGISAYAQYAAGAFEVMGDVFYSRLSGDVRQQTSIGELKGDSDLNVAGAEVKAKYDFKLSESFTLSPFAGIRYDRISADSINGKYGNERFKVKSMDVNLFEIPAGLLFSLSQASGAWQFEEKAQLFGEWRGGDNDVAIGSVISGATLEENAELDNRFGYGVRLGFDAVSGAGAIGAGYGYYGSSDTGSHNLYLKASYMF